VSQDLYDALGCPRDATAEEVDGALRERAKHRHPDVLAGAWRRASGSDPPASTVADWTARYKVAVEAHAVLSDPARREAYDRLGRDAARGSPAADLADLLGFGRQVTGVLVALQAPGEDPRQFAGRFAAAAAEDAFRAAMDPSTRRRVLDAIRRLGARRAAGGVPGT
jgi:DnaJ-class molecular chaperone